VSRVAAVGLMLLVTGCAAPPELVAYTPRRDVRRIVTEIPGCYAHNPGTNTGWWDLACLQAAGYRVEIREPALQPS